MLITIFWLLLELVYDGKTFGFHMLASVLLDGGLLHFPTAGPFQLLFIIEVVVVLVFHFSRLEQWMVVVQKLQKDAVIVKAVACHPTEYWRRGPKGGAVFLVQKRNYLEERILWAKKNNECKRISPTEYASHNYRNSSFCYLPALEIMTNHPPKNIRQSAGALPRVSPSF